MVTGMASSATYDKATGKTTVNPTTYTYGAKGGKRKPKPGETFPTGGTGKFFTNKNGSKVGKANALTRGKGKKKGLKK
jgi:hypothetical protein